MALLFLVVPLLTILAAQRISVLDRIGVVPLVFLLGFICALTLDTQALWGSDLQQTVIEVSVALALPLIIFAANIRTALRDAGGALRAIVAAFVAVVVTALVGTILFSGTVDGLPQVAALSVGAYTGSNINMGAINSAIDGDPTIFTTMITYDIVFSVVYMLVILLVGQRLAGLILPPYEATHSAEESAMAHLADESAGAYRTLLQRSTLAGSALVLVAAAVVVGLSVLVGELAPESLSSVAVILSITTLGLIGSLIPQLHKVKTSFHLGMVFILIFGFATGTTLDTTVLARMDLSLAGYFLFVIFGAMIVQALLCRLMGIDRDTFLIASGASVMSVPFIPVIAGALRNRALLVPGIAIAIIGYAVGNYLGIMVNALAGGISGGW